MARDLANLERSIEQLKANQQQIVRDSSKAIEELKANQEEMKTHTSEGFRTEPAQDVTRLRRSRLRPCASPSAHFSRRT